MLSTIESRSEKGQYELALADLNRAIELDPSLTVAYLNRGFVHKEKGQYVLAITDFNKVIELSSSSSLTQAAQKGIRDLEAK